jgi:glutathione synthase
MGSNASRSSLVVGVVMDPIAAINPKKDSTLAMMLEAQRRGHSLRYLELGDLFVRDGVAYGSSRAVTVQDQLTHFYQLGETQPDTPLGELDVILMRKDPPFDAEYIYATYVLERAEAAGALVVNKPRALRDCNEKLFTAWFPQCCPPTLVTRDAKRLHAFIAEHGEVVVKPLEGMGGRSIFRLDRGDHNTNVVFEMMTDYGSRYIMAQRFLPEISAGDKRVLLVDGEPIGTMLARVPAEGESRGNLAAGAKGVAQPLGERERWIAGQLGAQLRARGLIFVGIDVIGDYLTEINVTSPTGIREIDKLGGENVASELFDAIERRLADQPDS